MSKTVEAVEAVWTPGDRKPDDSRQRWVVCPLCPAGDCGRWLFGDFRLKAAGYKRACNRHAARERGDRRIQEGSDLEVLSGAIYHLGEVVPGEPDKRYVTCPICNERHKESAASKKELKRRRGICASCLPWGLLELKPEHYARRSSERSKKYAKIERILRALRADVTQIPRGQLMPTMPFWTLVKCFMEEFPDAAPQSNKSKSTHVRYLTLFFEDRPIGEIGPEAVGEFRRAMLSDTSRWGEPHSESTVGRMVGTLQRMFSFAKEYGWVKQSLFPRGVRLYPRVRFKTNRIMTLNEDEKLLAACGDDLELRASFIYMADTGIALRTVLGLRWSGVDFEKGVVAGAGGPVEMTPRLASALHRLRESSGGRSEGAVFSRKSDHLYQAWERARDAAGARGVTPIDIRRTCVWRMYQAGRRIEQIAASLGYGLDTASAYLIVDRETAESEIKSPRFQQFLHDQFGAPAQTQNGNGQKKGDESKAGRPPKFTDVEAFRAIDALGSRLSVSQLSKALKCSRTTVNNWAKRLGYESGEALVQARRPAGKGV